MSASSDLTALPDRAVSYDQNDYARRKAWIAHYFDRTAARAWEQLTSDAPVGAIRRSVRAARDRMRTTMSHWLPEDLDGARILDAGCGTGTLAIELAARGAHVVAIDLSPTLIALARERTPAARRSRIDFRSGDMLDASLGVFDYTVAMDSLIHYRAHEMLAVIDGFRQRTTRSVLFTVVPRTPVFSLLLAAGRLFPRGSRSPAVEPVSDATLHDGLAPLRSMGWYVQHTQRVTGGFYRSHAVALTHHGWQPPEGSV